jgi:hypothetical protein
VHQSGLHLEAALHVKLVPQLHQALVGEALLLRVYSRTASEQRLLTSVNKFRCLRSHHRLTSGTFQSVTVPSSRRSSLASLTVPVDFVLPLHYVARDLVPSRQSCPIVDQVLDSWTRCSTLGPIANHARSCDQAFGVSEPSSPLNDGVTRHPGAPLTLSPHRPHVISH